MKPINLVDNTGAPAKAIGTKLKNLGGGAVAFRCPGCDGWHHISVSGQNRPVWGWNGNGDAPTFTPSILVRYPAVPNPSQGYEEWKNERICHSFVRDGKIQYLLDCTHDLKGQTVELPDWDELLISK